MLTAGFDCSQDGDRRYFIMAGFVSSAEEWGEFDREWRARLAADNLPYFHMHAFAQSFDHPKPPFDESWVKNEKRRRGLLGDLLEIIQHRAWRKLGCIIPIESFNVFSDESRENVVQMQIVLAARLLWAELEVWRRASHFKNSVEMVFEDGDLGKGPLVGGLKEISGKSPKFEQKKDDSDKGIVAFTPLQASDILAYEIQKLTRQEGKSLDEIPFRFPYLQLEKLTGDIRMLKQAGAGLMDEFFRVKKYFDENPLPKPTVQ